MTSDADRVMAYANEATRCLLLARDMEHRMTEESYRCQVMCQEAGHRVAFETGRRLAAEEHTTAVEQWTESAIEQRTNSIKDEAWLRAEADRKAMATMHARIVELENLSLEAQQRLAAEDER